MELSKEDYQIIWQMLQTVSVPGNAIERVCELKKKVKELMTAPEPPI